MNDESAVFTAVKKKKLTTMRIIAAAMTISVVVYVVMAWFFSLQAEAGPPPEGPPPLRMPLIAVGITVGLAAVVLRLVLFTRERIEARLNAPVDLTRAAIDPTTRKADPALLESLKTLRESEQKIVSFLSWYQGPYIVQLALGESVALFGLVLAMISKNPYEMLPFAVISIYLIVRAALHPSMVLDQIESILNRLPRSR